MQLSFERLHPDAELPSQQHPGDAGLDLRSMVGVEVQPGGRLLRHSVSYAEELRPLTAAAVDLAA